MCHLSSAELDTLAQRLREMRKVSPDSRTVTEIDGALALARR